MYTNAAGTIQKGLIQIENNLAAFIIQEAEGGDRTWGQMQEPVQIFSRSHRKAAGALFFTE